MKSKAQKSPSFFKKVLDNYIYRVVINKDYKVSIDNSGSNGLNHNLNLSQVQ
jgi:hypothetical protein